MADYYPLIARAISGLDPGAPGEARRALYERARSALIAQLRGVHPPLTETEITRERLALEEAVRKVESEAAQRSRIEPPRADPLGRARPGDALRTSVRSRATPVDPNVNRERDRATLRGERPPLGQDERPDNSQRQARSQRPEPPRPDDDNDNSRRDITRPQPPGRERGSPASTGTGAPRRGSEPPQPPMRGFRDVMADVDDLGAAAAEASRSARRTYANVPSPSPEFDRIEPNMDNPAADNSRRYEDAPDQTDRYMERPPIVRTKSGKTAPPPPPPLPPRQTKQPKAPRTSSGFPLWSAILLGIVLVLAGAGILFGQKAARPSSKA